MKLRWQSYGLREEGALLAEEALPEMKRLIARMPPEIAKACLAEAIFQLYELPKRDPDFQKKYLEG